VPFIYGLDYQNCHLSFLKHNNLEQLLYCVTHILSLSSISFWLIAYILWLNRYSVMLTSFFNGKIFYYFYWNLKESIKIFYNNYYHNFNIFYWFKSVMLKKSATPKHIFCILFRLLDKRQNIYLSFDHSCFILKDIRKISILHQFFTECYHYHYIFWAHFIIMYNSCAYYL